MTILSCFPPKKCMRIIGRTPQLGKKVYQYGKTKSSITRRKMGKTGIFTTHIGNVWFPGKGAIGCFADVACGRVIVFDPPSLSRNVYLLSSPYTVTATNPRLVWAKEAFFALKKNPSITARWAWIGIKQHLINFFVYWGNFAAFSQGFRPFSEHVAIGLHVAEGAFLGPRIKSLWYLEPRKMLFQMGDPFFFFS